MACAPIAERWSSPIGPFSKREGNCLRKQNQSTFEPALIFPPTLYSKSSFYPVSEMIVVELTWFALRSALIRDFFDCGDLLCYHNSSLKTGDEQYRINFMQIKTLRVDFGVADESLHASIQTPADNNKPQAKYFEFGAFHISLHSSSPHYCCVVYCSLLFDELPCLTIHYSVRHASRHRHNCCIIM